MAMMLRSPGPHHGDGPLIIFVVARTTLLLPLIMIADTSLHPVAQEPYDMMSYSFPATRAVMPGPVRGVLPLIVLLLSRQCFWQADLAAKAVKGLSLVLAAVALPPAQERSHHRIR